MEDNVTTPSLEIRIEQIAELHTWGPKDNGRLAMDKFVGLMSPFCKNSGIFRHDAWRYVNVVVLSLLRSFLQKQCQNRRFHDET